MSWLLAVTVGFVVSILYSLSYGIGSLKGIVTALAWGTLGHAVINARQSNNRRALCILGLVGASAVAFQGLTPADVGPPMGRLTGPPLKIRAPRNSASVEFDPPVVLRPPSPNCSNQNETIFRQDNILLLGVNREEADTLKWQITFDNAAQHTASVTFDKSTYIVATANGAQYFPKTLTLVSGERKPRKATGSNLDVELERGQKVTIEATFAVDGVLTDGEYQLYLKGRFYPNDVHTGSFSQCSLFSVSRSVPVPTLAAVGLAPAPTPSQTVAAVEVSPPIALNPGKPNCAGDNAAGLTTLAISVNRIVRQGNDTAIWRTTFTNRGSESLHVKLDKSLYLVSVGDGAQFSLSSVSVVSNDQHDSVVGRSGEFDVDPGVARLSDLHFQQDRGIGEGDYRLYLRGSLYVSNVSGASNSPCNLASASDPVPIPAAASTASAVTLPFAEPDHLGKTELDPPSTLDRDDPACSGVNAASLAATEIILRAVERRQGERVVWRLGFWNHGDSPLHVVIAKSPSMLSSTGPRFVGDPSTDLDIDGNVQQSVDVVFQDPGEIPDGDYRLELGGSLYVTDDGSARNFRCDLRAESSDIPLPSLAATRSVQQPAP